MRKMIIKSIVNQAKESTKNWKTIKLDIYESDRLAMMNNRCQYNALGEYRAKRAVAILEVFGGGIAHYICMNEHGELYDPTLGWSFSGTEYKLSRYVHPIHEGDFNDNLINFKNALFEMASPTTKLLARLFFVKPSDCF